MMFGLTSLELRLAGYAFVLAAICGLLLYIHHSGYEACKAPQKAADKAQVEKDLADAKGTINDLKAQLAAIPAPQPPPVLRLCPQPRSVRAGTAPGGAQPLVAGTSAESPDRVPAGTPGIDIGQPVSDVERAAEIIAIFRDTTWEWAVRQSTPLPH